MNTKVFLSHAGEDRAQALELRSQLLANGVECWCYQLDLPHGQHLIGEVEKAIREADWFLVLLTPDSQQSDWVKRELGLALELRGPAKWGRPVILPVLTSGNQPADRLIQPHFFRSNLPFGEPFNYGEFRAHVLGSEPLEDLLQTLTLRVTKIVYPNGEHRELFESLMILWKELFPDPDLHPSEEDVEGWLQQANFAGIGNRPELWPDLLFALNYPGHVVGFFYIALDPGRKLGWATHLGIAKPWRTESRMPFILRKVREEILRIDPQISGVYFEVDTLPSGFLEDGEGVVAVMDTDGAQSACKTLWLLELYRSMGASWVTGSDGRPARFIHPRMELPLKQAIGEPEQHLLYLPVSRGPAVGQADLVAASYHDGFYQGWGPPGHDLQGYSDYLREIVEKQADLLGGQPGLASIRIGRRGKELMRKMGRDFI